MKLLQLKTITLIVVLLSFFWCGLYNTDSAFAQKKEGYILHGIIYNTSTKKPVDSGTVFILELKKKENCDANGVYRIAVPKPGVYTVIVRSEGLKMTKTAVAIDGDIIKNFPLDVVIKKSEGLTITGKRDIQTVSRHTMNLQQLKEVPATFGDSINAIASLPGIIRTGGDLFGPIVIRGGDYLGVKYLVDDIPIYSPLHYGGLHSIINSNLINEIDVYSSAFPAEIGSATSAVIAFNTVDEVKEFSGYTDLSLLSASALVQTPIIKNSGLGSPLEDYKKDQKNVGYIIASGRISYIDLIVIPIVGWITGDNINMVPSYWDYQFKAKYFLNKDNSLTLMALGSKDFFKFRRKNQPELDGSDPLLTGLRVNTDQMTHGQSLTYAYQPNERFRNRLIFSSSLRENSISVNIPAPGVSIALKNIRIKSKPYVFGLTDKFKIVAVPKYFEIRGGAEYNLYYFTASGFKPVSAGGGFTFDLANNNYITDVIKEKIYNHTIGGYLETKFTYGGLTIMPGFRSDYLQRNGETTWDPRGLISYEFPTNTTISLAGGKYSYFFQTNPNYFDANTEFAKVGKEGTSEWAIHRVAGLEQKIGLFSIKVEGFWNDFYDLVKEYAHIGPDASYRHTMSTGRIKAYGGEIMLKKDRKEGEKGVFGWVSYTYTRSRSKSGLPDYPGIYGILISNTGGLPTSYNDLFMNRIGDPWGKQWLNYDYEQNHSFKLILGYVTGKHTITGKFMLFTSMPYTPIVASILDEQNLRYYPIYGRPNSRHFPLNHRLDLRYTHTTTYSWGNVSWYIELINAYNYRPKEVQQWNYLLPYLGSHAITIRNRNYSNPKITSYSGSLALIPNFGVEAKF